MKRYLGFLSYDGSAYAGYQIQNAQQTVQGVLENSLSTVLNVPVKTKGSSRTDAGVHAYCNGFHFDCEKALPVGFLKKINSVLPKDISLFQIKEVDEDFHARFMAIERTYVYKACLNKDPFNEGRAYCLSGKRPDIVEMNKAAGQLLAFKDFASFRKTGTNVKTSLCDIRYALWEKVGDHDIQFTIRGNRFLRGMVRGVVGTLLKVGRGFLSQEEFVEIIRTGAQEKVDFSVPAYGLYLQKVIYPGFNE